MKVLNPNSVDLTHFRIETSIGKGGFGKVNCVTQRKSNVLYAMKTLNKQKCFSTENGVKQVFTELELLSQCQNEFICNAHFAFQDEDNLYLVMDLALGGDLKFHLANQEKFPEPLVKFLGACIASGLIYLHGIDVIHRDIKPANILMNTEGYAKITDFGLASKIENLDKNEVCGTDGYIAPESYHGTNTTDYNLVKVADWFAFGVCLYMFTVGSKPFSTTKRLSKRPEDVQSAFARLEKVEVSEELKDLIRQLLQVDPQKRLGRVNGGDDIVKHPFFKGFDWAALTKGTLEAPFRPDTSKKNVDRRMSLLDLEEQLVGFNAYAPKFSQANQHVFERYMLNTELTPEDVDFIAQRKSICCSVQ